MPLPIALMHESRKAGPAVQGAGGTGLLASGRGCSPGCRTFRHARLIKPPIYSDFGDRQTLVGHIRQAWSPQQHITDAAGHSSRSTKGGRRRQARTRGRGRQAVVVRKPESCPTLGGFLLAVWGPGTGNPALPATDAPEAGWPRSDDGLDDSFRTRNRWSNRSSKRETTTSVGSLDARSYRPSASVGTPSEDRGVI